MNVHLQPGLPLPVARPAPGPAAGPAPAPGVRPALGRDVLQLGAAALGGRPLEIQPVGGGTPADEPPRDFAGPFALAGFRVCERLDALAAKRSRLEKILRVTKDPRKVAELRREIELVGRETKLLERLLAALATVRDGAGPMSEAGAKMLELVDAALAAGAGGSLVQLTRAVVQAERLARSLGQGPGAETDATVPVRATTEARPTPAID